MKTFAMSLAAAVILTATASSPAFAGGVQENVQLGTRGGCLPNAVRCVRSTRPPPSARRCWIIVVRDHSGTQRKKRVCPRR